MLASELSVRVVRAVARPITILVNHIVEAISRLRLYTIDVLIHSFDFVSVGEHFPSSELSGFQLNCQISNQPFATILWRKINIKVATI